MSLKKIGQNSATLVPSALLAGALYFVLTSLQKNKNKELYILSTVVLISAYLLLSQQKEDNKNSEYNDQSLRYFNWLIDVPLLLYIYGKTLNISTKYLITIVVAGIAMVILGYVSLHIEKSWFFGAASILCFAYVAYKCFQYRTSNIIYIFWLLSWELYTIPYLIEYNSSKETYIPEIEILYGIADILTKIVLPYFILSVKNGKDSMPKL